MKRLISFCINRSLLINIITVSILIAGVMFLRTAKREAFPKIDFDYVIINTIYPGSSAEDVEKYITISIEEQMREIDGIDELTSSSIEARSIVVLKLDPDLGNKDKTINDIKNAIDRIDDFPEDTEDPIVTELSTAQTPVLTISLLNKNGIDGDKDEFQLRKYAKMLEDRLLDTDGVAKIDKQGYREREMIVEVNPYLLDEYHVAINEIIIALSKKNLNFPGGVIKDEKGDILIRTIGEVEGVDDIKNVLIRANEMGNMVKIKNVANVKDSFEEEKIITKTLGKQSIVITAIKKESADIIDLVDRINSELKRFEKILPKDYELSTSNDMSYFVKRRLSVLTNNGIIGSLLVVITLFVTLGWRISLVTALGLPLAFSITFIWMGYTDLSVNLLSMFGLIVVLGMLVDDAIVVAENIYRHLEEGYKIRDAVINGTSEVIMPVAGTILTTIAAFAPLMLMTGIMGKFMWMLPAVITVSLLASWIEAMLILPSHVMDVEKRRKISVEKLKLEEGGGLHSFFQEKYMTILSRALKNKNKVLAGVSVFFILTIIFAAFNLKIIMFPAGNIEIFVVKAESPTATSVQQMSNNLLLIEKLIAKLPKKEVDSFISKAGVIMENPHDPNAKRGSNYGIIHVYLTPMEERDRTANEIMDYLRSQSNDFKVFDKLEYKSIRTGPPVGSAVSVTIKGNEFNVLQKISGEYKTFLESMNSKRKILKDIKDNFEEGKDELRVHVNEELAAITGISVLDIASTIRSCFEGAVASTIKKTDEEIDIRVMFPEKLRGKIASLNTIKVANRTGNLIPLSRVINYKQRRSISVVSRNSWRRSITVTADIDENAKGVSSLEINKQVMKKFKDIADRYPGYTVSYEGEFKDTQESMENLGRSFLIAFLIIYIILVALFRSMLHPLVIMSVIPLTAVGVIWTFAIHGLPFSFLAIMGIVGLTGVVVNDSIIYVDFIRKFRKKGYEVYEATIEAGRSRLRPVFLTTITTFFGLVPTAYGIGGNDPFLKPMAISMSWGLVFGTLITLICTPLIYNVQSNIRSKLFGERLWVEEGETPGSESTEKISETIKMIKK